MNTSDLTTSNPVQIRYTMDGLPERLKAALSAVGYGEADRVPYSALAQVDQFHVGGLPAITDMADSLGVKPGDEVLDLGSGLGGPARYLAAERGCHVTGIELTPMYVEIAKMLSMRTGLAGKTRFVQGDATDLPFHSASFDHAWTQHVAMNIEDKEQLYRGVYRVLKPGGRFAMYDPVAGLNSPLLYPVPWAHEAAINFLSSEDEVLSALAGAGFRIISKMDATEQGITWFNQRAAAPPVDNPLSFPALVDPNIRQSAANFGQNLREGRVRLIKLVAQKD